MKKRMKNAKLHIVLFAIFALCLSACSKTEGNQEMSDDTHEEITNELISILDENPEVREMLVQSIDMAKAINPNKETNPVQTLEEYYAYVDWASKAMPWNISKDLPASGLYERIDQSLNYFYFINDQPLPQLDGRGLYNNSLQYAEPYRSWLISFTKNWGQFLSTEESWNEGYYRLAYEDERFGLQEDWYEDSSNWRTFNDFFSRHLKSPDKRPIFAPDDGSVVVAPADSLPQGVWQIDGDSNIVQQAGGELKSKKFDSVAELIGEGSAYRDAFRNGVLTHTFLDVHDYHRFHFPVGGVVKEVRTIPQDDAVGGFVVWDEEDQKYVLNAEIPGWQMIETRSCAIVETEKYGLVALLPIGMSQVSSVNFEENVKVGNEFKKGDSLGYFLFGGSDLIMIFQKDAGFEITAPGDDDGDGYAHIYMGERYGVLKG